MRMTFPEGSTSRRLLRRHRSGTHPVGVAGLRKAARGAERGDSGMAQWPSRGRTAPIGGGDVGAEQEPADPAATVSASLPQPATHLTIWASPLHRAFASLRSVATVAEVYDHFVMLIDRDADTSRGVHFDAAMI